MGYQLYFEDQSERQGKVGDQIVGIDFRIAYKPEEDATLCIKPDFGKGSDESRLDFAFEQCRDWYAHYVSGQPVWLTSRLLHKPVITELKRFD